MKQYGRLSRCLFMLGNGRYGTPLYRQLKHMYYYMSFNDIKIPWQYLTKEKNEIICVRRDDRAPTA